MVLRIQLIEIKKPAQNVHESTEIKRKKTEK